MSKVQSVGDNQANKCRKLHLKVILHVYHFGRWEFTPLECYSKQE